MDAKAQGRVLSESEILEIEHRQASWVLREQVNNLIATIRDLQRKLDERDRQIAELRKRVQREWLEGGN